MPASAGDDRFEGRSFDPGWGRLFGGQVFAQALGAAQQTVDPARRVCSCSGAFLRSGDTKAPVLYEVDRTRDGRSFSVRQVRAIQLGRPILTLTATSQTPERGLEHGATMSSAPPPEDLPGRVSPVRASAPLDIRVVDPNDRAAPKVRAPARQVWLRTWDKLPSDPIAHARLWAYASDFHLLTTALEPHGVTFATPGMQVATLQHNVWFHRPFRMDRWLLYVIDSPVAAGGRALCRGRLFTRDGVLVASTAQEGLIRQRPVPPAAR